MLLYRLRDYLGTMRLHMPPQHRLFISKLEAGASARAAALKARSSCREAYNDVIAELEKFRGQHRAFARSYIAQWSKAAGREGEKGTGGSDFMPALQGYRATTAAHKIS